MAKVNVIFELNKIKIKFIDIFLVLFRTSLKTQLERHCEGVPIAIGTTEAISTFPPD
ncbi:MAG: hypothetical protein WC599_02385 [Bacteroidales bacterium]